MENSTTPTAHLHVLDVRPWLQAATHPLDAVMARVDTLPKGGLLVILAPFEPVPMMEKLRARGCSVASGCVGASAWMVRVGCPVLPPWEDLTMLEAPLPLEHVLRTCSTLAAGQVITAWLPRRPMMLLPQLQARGLLHEVAEHPDGTATLWVRGSST